MRKTSPAYVGLILREARREVGDQALVGPGLFRAEVTCHAPSCGRKFIGLQRLTEHAEAVHTFDDIRRILSEFLREKYGRSSTPTSNGTWVWIDDLADDWVVFQVEEGNESTLLKAAYSITGNDVTLGDPVEVVRRTVYDPVKAAE